MSTDRKLSGSVTWREQNIFRPSDFTRLVADGKVLVVTPTGFNRIQKLQWFRDSYFRKIHAALHDSGTKPQHDH